MGRLRSLAPGGPEASGPLGLLRPLGALRLLGILNLRRPGPNAPGGPKAPGRPKTPGVPPDGLYAQGPHTKKKCWPLNFVSEKRADVV